MDQSSSVVAESKPQSQTHSDQRAQTSPQPSQGTSPVQGPQGQTPQQRGSQPDSEARYTRRSALLSNPRTKWIVIIVALVIVVGVFFLWRYLSSYESTDDAQIDGHINSVSARVSGHVIKLNVDDN